MEESIRGAKVAIMCLAIMVFHSETSVLPPQLYNELRSAFGSWFHKYKFWFCKYK